MSQIITQPPYYTKPPSLLDTNLHVSVRLLQCQLHGSEISLSEGAKTVSRLLLFFCRHSNCSLPHNDPISRSLLAEMSLAAYSPLRRQNCCFYGGAAMNLQQLNLHIWRDAARGWYVRQQQCYCLLWQSPHCTLRQKSALSMWKHVEVSVIVKGCCCSANAANSCLEIVCRFYSEFVVHQLLSLWNYLKITGLSKMKTFITSNTICIQAGKYVAPI